MMTNLPDFILVERLNQFDLFRQGYIDKYNINLEKGYNYEQMEEELESRQPVDDISYFGDCEGKEVFCPMELFDDDGNEIEPYITIRYPDEI